MRQRLLYIDNDVYLALLGCQFEEISASVGLFEIIQGNTYIIGLNNI